MAVTFPCDTQDLVTTSHSPYDKNRKLLYGRSRKVVRALQGILSLCCLFLVACSIQQKVQPVQKQSETTICIIEDPAVRKGFLETYQQVLRERGYTVRTIPKGSDKRACELTTTYTGLWSWHNLIYLAYARIEVFRDGHRVGLAEYDSRSGMANFEKFIQGSKKVRELVENLFPMRVIKGIPLAPVQVPMPENAQP